MLRDLGAGFLSATCSSRGWGGGGGDNFHFMVSTTSDLISRYTCRQFVE